MITQGLNKAIFHLTLNFTGPMHGTFDTHVCNFM